MDEGPDVLFYNETSVPEVTRYKLELKKAGDTWSSARSKFDFISELPISLR